ncbi:MAG: hypothetical protein QQN60_08300 [Nitrosopumilus sp.]
METSKTKVPYVYTKMKETWEDRCRRLGYCVFDCWAYDSGENMGFEYYEYT